MITKLAMPRLSETTSTGTILAWLVNEGEKVVKGAPLLEVETDKATVEVESPADGFLRKVVYDKGSTVDALTVIALLADDLAEELPEIETDDLAASAELADETRAEPVVGAQGHGRERTRLLSSPMAARLAKEKGIELTEVEGTGPDGRITRADVLRAASRKPEMGDMSVATVVPLSKMRKAIAQSTVESKRVAPHGYVLTEIDMSAVIAYRERLNLEARGSETAACSFTDILIKGVAIALRDFPWLNSCLREEGLVIWRDINIGFVVSLEDEGLIVPVVRNADRKSVIEIAHITSELVKKAKQRRMAIGDYSGGTFTISNMGMHGVDSFIAVINPPQSAILAVGRIAKRPYVIGDEVRPVPLMKVTLSSDHRVIDGVLAARFLERLDAILKEPQVLDSTGEGVPSGQSRDQILGTAEQER